MVSAYCSLGVVEFELQAEAGGGRAWPRRISELAPGALRAGQYGRSPATVGTQRASGPAEGGYDVTTTRLVNGLKEALDPRGILAPASRLLPVRGDTPRATASGRRGHGARPT